jgi:DNA-binding transcriptional MerR regulator
VKDLDMLSEVNNRELDFEWLVLIKVALDQGVTKEEIRSFLKGDVNINMNVYANINVDKNINVKEDLDSAIF